MIYFCYGDLYVNLTVQVLYYNPYERSHTTFTNHFRWRSSGARACKRPVDHLSVSSRYRLMDLGWGGRHHIKMLFCCC